MAPIRDFASAPRKRAFTLIELMVATAIMTLLVLAVMSVTSHVLTTWSSASGRLGANAEARNALQYLGDDLETLVVRPKRQVWLEVQHSDVNVGGKTTRFPNISLITATEHRVRSGTDYGNICAVNYALDFRHPITGSTAGPTPAPVMGLYRRVINPSDTFSQVLTPPVGSDPGDLNSLYDLMGNSSNPPSFENFLNSNIVDLSVDFYAENLNTASGQPATIKVSDANGNAVDFMYGDKIYTPAGTELNTNLGRLVYADIRMTVLSDDGAKALAVASVTGQSAEDIIRQHGVVFSRRVPILSRY